MKTASSVITSYSIHYTKLYELEDKLAKKEAELKRQYGQMEGALGQMESTSSAWDNFNTSQGK